MGRTIEPWSGRVRALFREERGLGLVESLVAVTVLGVAVAAFIVALSVGSVAVREQDRLAVAQGLATTQLEYVKGYPYDPGATTYPAVDSPENYNISVAVISVPDTGSGLQKITVTIFQESENLTTVEGYKVNR